MTNSVPVGPAKSNCRITVHCSGCGDVDLDDLVMETEIFEHLTEDNSIVFSEGVYYKSDDIEDRDYHDTTTGDHLLRCKKCGNEIGLPGDIEDFLINGDSIDIATFIKETQESYEANADVA